MAVAFSDGSDPVHGKHIVPIAAERRSHKQSPSGGTPPLVLSDIERIPNRNGYLNGAQNADRQDT